MQATELFRTGDRSEWRRWFTENHSTAKEIWLVFPKKEAGEPYIPYNDAVEEALCFGWIDGQLSTLDDLHYARRFTPRRKGSPYSRLNIERLIWLDSEGLLHPAIEEETRSIRKEEYAFPFDILDEIRADEDTWENFQSFTEPYKRIRIAYIDSARNRPEEFRKRLDSFLRMTAQGKTIDGYGGAEKYYRQ